MPETPEGETIKRKLEQLVMNKKIENNKINWPKIIQATEGIIQFKNFFMGEQSNNKSRRGKFLLFNMQDYVLVSHLRMEGKYRVTHSSEPIDKHTHVIFHFTDGTELRYNDVRKFGTMHLYPIGKENETKPLNQLGPDPFE